MILFITRQIPHPPEIGLRIRQRHLLEACARVAPVQLVFGFDREDELLGVAALEPFCESIHPVPMEWHGEPQNHSLVQLLREVRRMRQLVPLNSRQIYCRGIQRMVEKLAPSCRLIQVERLNMVSHVQALLDHKQAGQRFVLDLDDVETDLKRDWLRLFPPPRRMGRVAARFDLALLESYQKRTIGKFDRTLVTSEADRQRLGGGFRPFVIPNGADIPDHLPIDESDGRTLLCLGTFGYRPNADGLQDFLDHVLPLIRIERPEVRLLIVGRDMPDRFKSLDDGEHILVNADVPDVSPYYRQATVSIVPLRLGGGTRLKILESFAVGTPVVSTTVGCAGLDVEAGKHLLVADKHRDFAQACLSLLRDAEQRRALSEAARERVEQGYSWQSSRDRMAGLISDLLEESS